MPAKPVIESFANRPAYWRENGDNMMADVVALEHSLETEFPQLEQLDLCSHSNGALHISSIKVKPDSRNQGIGSAVMSRIKAFARERGMPVTLSPEPDRGKKDALTRFYRGHGFWANKGRRADYRYTSPFAPIMIWKPGDP